MQQYASAPYDQPASVISTLAAGNWRNPPGSGLGLRPTASTGVPLLDAYLWVKTPGQSDGQCDSAGGARAWDYADYTQPGWPATAPAQSLFDPLWVPTTRRPETGSARRHSSWPACRCPERNAGGGAETITRSVHYLPDGYRRLGVRAGRG